MMAVGREEVGSRQSAVGRESVGSGQSTVGRELQTADCKLPTNKLPKGWQTITVGELVEIKYGKGLRNDKRITGNVKVFGSNGVVGNHNKGYTKAPTIIIGRKGSVGQIHLSMYTCWPIDTTYFIDGFVGIDYKYLYHSLRTLDLAGLESSSAIPGINRNSIYQLPLPLPPINEQKRIVAKLDAIMPRIEAVKERLDKVPGILKRFRQSVLTAAVTGKLTEQWREEHPEVESAEVLLDKALDLKEFEYKKDCDLAQKTDKRNPKSYFFNNATVEIEDISFPSSWVSTYLGNISWVQGGIQKTPKRKPVKNFYKYLTVANVYRGFLKLDEVNSFEATKNELEQLKLKKSDLLIVEGNGSATEIGRCAIWNDEIENCIHQNHIIRARPLSNLIESKYCLLFFNSNFGIKIMMDAASTTSGLYTLSVTKINNLPILLPPLEEQKEIVRQVDKLFALADKVEAHYQKAKARMDKLSQSVLAKAFRGELVPQDPNDEPVEKLLERIQEEKARLVGSKQSAGGRKKSVSSGQSIVGSELQTADCPLPTKKQLQVRS
ncbi:MAG: restriction endonuclease subunit S [Chitinivibrionales bacterium]|nr:restriction endonuclease subunit S [Chitinivibrionales bacterium]